MNCKLTSHFCFLYTATTPPSCLFTSPRSLLNLSPPPLASTFTCGRQLVGNVHGGKTPGVTWQPPPTLRPTQQASISLAVALPLHLFYNMLPCPLYHRFHPPHCPSCDVAAAAALRALSTTPHLDGDPWLPQPISHTPSPQHISTAFSARPHARPLSNVSCFQLHLVLLIPVLIIQDYAPYTRLCQEYPTCLFIAMLSCAKGMFVINVLYEFILAKAFVFITVSGGEMG
ncbi:hypothetical protein CVT26_015207 [Gymnopilus dilepis]|uniref:Uncharacterized protein n=1 Tax=Gymnopilus dilepis TaxID=231916 RepID=A0A409X7B1_9AGAR|nr:hypothetical protein CVT26_015207 [Gymnopilus dilepis]